MTRAERLQAYIDASTDAPVIGIDDCGPWVARWIGVDYPKYTSRARGYVIARQAGGLVALTESLLTPLGISETAIPELGDIGILQFSDRETAAIFCCGGLAAVRGETAGVLFVKPHTILKSWGVP